MTESNVANMFSCSCDESVYILYMWYAQIETYHAACSSETRHVPLEEFRTGAPSSCFFFLISPRVVLTGAV